MKWTQSNVPDYSSDRVTVEHKLGDTERRHQWHSLIIKIDNEIVASQEYYEDDDFPSNNEEIPNSKDLWENFVKTLPKGD